mmetsp:Transcript_710/g.83  ORF Transcript_710/g.83 Transcript_710/m.83 type:complete len:89 (-) Transcript_710:122-388(-)
MFTANSLLLGWDNYVIDNQIIVHLLRSDVNNPISCLSLVSYQPSCIYYETVPIHGVISISNSYFKLLGLIHFRLGNLPSSYSLGTVFK